MNKDFTFENMRAGGKDDALIGVRVTGDTEEKYPDMNADAGRLPTSLVIDTSGSMRRYADLLHDAVINLIEKLAENDTAREHIDLQIMTFSGDEDVKVVIHFQELYNLLDKNRKLKEEYKNKLVFKCNGGTPTGYALAGVMRSLRRRYDKLKDAGKSPYCPILLFMSDGKPEVHDDEKEVHDKVLTEALSEIKQLVAAKRLSSVAVEVGDICEMQDIAGCEKDYEEMHRIMRGITGLDDDHHVVTARDADAIMQFFKFTETMLQQSVIKKDFLANIDVRKIELN